MRKKLLQTISHNIYRNDKLDFQVCFLYNAKFHLDLEDNFASTTNILNIHISMKENK